MSETNCIIGIKTYILPFTNQVMFGAGAPCALHEIVASFPSNAVKFCGGFNMTGDDARNKKTGHIKFDNINNSLK